MKTTERHRLKTNEVAQTIADLLARWEGSQRRILAAAVVVVVVAALVGGYFAWQQSRSARAQVLLAEAMAVAAAPVTSAAPAGTPPAPGAYFTERARAEAALQKFQQVAATYGSTKEGVAARFEAAGLLASLGRTADAEREFRTLAERDASSVYGRMARLGLAEVQVQAKQYDAAVATLRELAGKTDGEIPVDGVLMRLARAYQLAGRPSEALQTLTRVVEQFPDSLYAAEARREVQALKAPGRAS